MTRRHQGGWVHALILLLLVIAAVLYVGLPYLMATACEPGDPPPPLAFVVRDGDMYCLWQITPAVEMVPMPEYPPLRGASARRCSSSSIALQREADIFNGNRIPAAGKQDALDCKRPSMLYLINDATAFWKGLLQRAPTLPAVTAP